MIICAIPVYNGEQFILQTLQSMAKQTLKPDRVVVLDNCSTDRTPQIVREFKELEVEYVRNPSNLGLFGNCNRALDFAGETEYLQILHADDLIEPRFYEVMTRQLEDCHGRGLAWCLDERIDENNRRLSLSGRPDGRVRVLSKDQFLRMKAELANQAFCATLLKTNGQPIPCRFPADMAITSDSVFWPTYGSFCQKLVTVNLALAKYRWHGSNATTFTSPSVQAIVIDEWRTMKTVEALRGKSWSLLRAIKLKGLLGVRAGIKAKRVRQNGDPAYSQVIAEAAKAITGLPLWLAAQMIVAFRDFVIFTILRRPRHPKNIYS